MAGKGMRGLNEALRSLCLSSQMCREAASHRVPSATFTRSMATEAPLPKIATSVDPTASSIGLWRPNPMVPVTIYDFPSYEPTRLEEWSSKHLHLPLRRDILHLAVIYEGDNTRQGTASSKTRFEVHGSNRKIHPQKGTGKARAGDKKSPLRKGGGKSFGPKPRDFGTNLNRKVYDLAWRMALSYRYRRGELIVCSDGMELPMPDEFESLAQLPEMPKKLVEGFRQKWVKQILARNEWGRCAGRSTFITNTRRENLFNALDLLPNSGRALEVEDVDVKDLLETGRLVVERSALEEMIKYHQSDLVTRIFMNGIAKSNTPETGKIVVE